MTNEKNPKDINTTNNSQASSSGSSSTISKQEKARRKHFFKAELVRFYYHCYKLNFNQKQFEEEWKELYSHHLKIFELFAEKIIRELAKEADKEAKQKLKAEYQAREQEASGSNTQEKPEEATSKKDKGKEKNREQAELTAEREKFTEQLREAKADREKIYQIREAQAQELLVLEKARKTMSVSSSSTSGNKEVIKAEISKELTEIKETFSNLAISETTEAEIIAKSNKFIKQTDLEIQANRSLSNAGVGFVSLIPIVGQLTAADQMRQLDYAWHNTVKKYFPEQVKKLVNKATADLNEQKNEAVKKIDALILARNKEVVRAQEVILHLESVIRKLGEEKQREKELSEVEISKLKETGEEIIKDLKEKAKGEKEKAKELSNKEIEKLREEIGKVLELKNKAEEEWKKAKDKEDKYENWLKEKSASNMKKRNEETPRATFKDKDTEIAELRKHIEVLNETIDNLKMEASFYEDSRDQRALELKNEKELHELTKETAKKELEREKQFLNNEIARKEAEIERIKENAKSELKREKHLWEHKLEAEKKAHNFDNTEWQANYNLLKTHRDQTQKDLDRLVAERAEEKDDREQLKAKVKNLKIDKASLQNKNTELEEKLEATKPSWIYRVCDKIGLVKAKNMAVNSLLIIGLIAVIYVISLVLKYLVKPTFGNLKGLWGSKKTKRIPEESEEDEEEQNIIELEPEKAEPKKLPKRTRKKKVSS